MSPDPGAMLGPVAMANTSGGLDYHPRRSPSSARPSHPPDDTSTAHLAPSTSRRQRSVGTDGPSENEGDHFQLPPPPSTDVINQTPSTSSALVSSNVLQQPNPRRHRQRLANHYLQQIRAEQQQTQTNSSLVDNTCHRSSSCTSNSHHHHHPQQTPPPPFHHYYHPYQQQHHLLSHHYPTSYPHGFYSRSANLAQISSSSSFTRGPGRSQRSSNERSPFLMVKVLLFTLMTVDFVMNTIGLAVIAVMAKNHFNNLAVERSLHPPPPLDRDLPPPEDPYRAVYNHPAGGGGNEWTVILPLLPSFIFVEILTLVGMFGVFADLFSFTMTYAILKLITSLCYPSMASTAAVAAMASSSSTGSGFQGQGGVGIGSMSPVFGGSGSQTNIAPSLLPLPLPENFTAFLNQAKFINLNRSSSSTTENPILSVILVDTTTTMPPPSWAVSTVKSNSFEEGVATSQTLTSTTPTSASNQVDAYNNYKHTRLKHDKLMAQLKAMKKTEKMAKLKQREKQLRSKLQRLESAETGSTENSWISGGGTPLEGSHSARIALLAAPSSVNPQPLGSIFHDPSSNGSSSFLFAQSHSGHLPNASNSSHHNSHNNNFKYHHRVWEALLCTFQVIFAVAFAFNTLTINARRQLEGRGSSGGTGSGGGGDYYYGSDYEEGVEGGGCGRAYRLPRRTARRYRNCGRPGYSSQWPYSPLATSIDAYYFAQYQLPPPPPPYFAAAASTSEATSQGRSSSLRPHPLGATPPPSRCPLEVTPTVNNSRWSRLTPSWLLRGGTSTNRNTSLLPSPSSRRPRQSPSPSPPPPLSRSPSVRSMPPLYEDIHHHDQVIVVGCFGSQEGEDNSGQRTLESSFTTTRATTSATPERILLQVITTAEIEHHHHHHHPQQPTPPEAPSRGGRRAARRLALSSSGGSPSLETPSSPSPLSESTTTTSSSTADDNAEQPTQDNITTIKVPETTTKTDESLEDGSKTLVITVNENDTRV